MGSLKKEIYIFQVFGGGGTCPRDRRCGLGGTSLLLTQRTRVRSPVGSISWLRRRFLTLAVVHGRRSITMFFKSLTSWESASKTIAWHRNISPLYPLPPSLAHYHSFSRHWRINLKQRYYQLLFALVLLFS